MIASDLSGKDSVSLSVLNMATLLYNSDTDASILSAGFFAYEQLPTTPLYIDPTTLTSGSLDLNNLPDLYFLPNLLDSTPDSSAGTALDTNGLAFNGALGYSALAYYSPLTSGARILTGNTLSTTPNEGYVGFSNYAITRGSTSGLGNILNSLTFTDINNILSDPQAFVSSLQLAKVNENFPVLDTDLGFTLNFDLSISEEASQPNRAGFTLLLIGQNLQGLELGFKADGSNPDYVFAQNIGFNSQGEDSRGTSLDLSANNSYQLSVANNAYQLFANGTLLLSGSLRDYVFDPLQSDPPFPESFNPYETPSLLFMGDNTDQGFADFVLGTVGVTVNAPPTPPTLTPDKYDDYLASHPDLIQAFGYNLLAAKNHYEQSGAAEGRQIDTFNEALYLASHPDLILAFGGDLEAATRHYIQAGFYEGRQVDRFIPELYLDAYSDLKNAFGNDLEAATLHYIQNGFYEGRDFLLGFDPGAYIASHLDLIAAFGYDLAAGREHYITNGYDENRMVTFDPDDYIASHPDLIAAFDYNLAAATEHYIRTGVGENRITDDFNEVAYLAKYSDLQGAYGNDLVAATRHFILYGFAEGRTDDLVAA